MGRPPSIPAEKKARIVMSVIAGELSVAEAARREKVSEQSIGRWKADFLEAGKTALVAGKSGPSRSTGSSTTRSGRTRPSPGTGHRRCTWAWPTPPSRPFNPQKSCQLLDAGHRHPPAEPIFLPLLVTPSWPGRGLR